MYSNQVIVLFHNVAIKAYSRNKNVNSYFLIVPVFASIISNGILQESF